MEITKLEEEAVESYMDAGDFRAGVLGVLSSTWRCEGGEIVADSFVSKANIICELARRAYLAPSTMEVQALLATINALKDENERMRRTALVEVGLSPEFRSALVKAFMRGKAGPCNICFTDSWQPCDEAEPNAINHPELGWIVCECCRLAEQLRVARANTPQGFGPEGRVN